ncbi:hypothetical protein F5B21DRAFT_89009 [Xylaria acuta]|nr:hypothetical protein F5B21DRAFT_89009 [Xylaria acuta]
MCCASRMSNVVLGKLDCHTSTKVWDMQGEASLMPVLLSTLQHYTIAPVYVKLEDHPKTYPIPSYFGGSRPLANPTMGLLGVGTGAIAFFINCQVRDH